MYINTYNFLLFLCNSPHLQVYRFYSARFLPWGRFWDTCIYFKGGAYSKLFALSNPEGTILKVGTDLSIYDAM